MLHIFGGTYRESCSEGSWDQIFGSGLRASAVVRGLGCQVSLATCVDDDTKPHVLSICKSFDVDVRLTSRPTSVSFNYPHSLAVPIIRPTPESFTKLPTLHGKVKCALVFGMIEARCNILANRIVYDPQSPHAPAPFDSPRSADQSRALVCNAREIRLLTGEQSVQIAATALVERNEWDVVVVKHGAGGALVSSTAGADWIPAYRTERVWPIGTGDVFAAVFALKWGIDGSAPDQAAKYASRAVAYYSNSKSVPIPQAALDSPVGEPLEQSSGLDSKQVYLAGPFFNMMERWMIDQSRQALTDQGMNVFSPMHDVGFGTAEEVVGPDLIGLEKSDVVFAIVDHLDPGTLFEVGHAVARGKPVVAFAQSSDPESLKMLQGTACLVCHDFASAVYQTAWISR